MDCSGQLLAAIGSFVQLWVALGSLHLQAHRNTTLDLKKSYNMHLHGGKQNIFFFVKNVCNDEAHCHDFHAKNFGQLWVTSMQPSWSFLGQLWVALVSSGKLLAALGSSGLLWAAPGSSGQLLAALASSWQLWAAPGSSGQLLGSSG